ncbi:MAG: CHAT domain-containing protein [Bacteroidales bacterium]
MNETQNVEDLIAANETALLTVKLNEMIKSSFGAENTKLIFTSRANDLYNLAVITSVELYKLTGEHAYYDVSFRLSEQSKGAVLLSSIRELEAIEIGNIPEEIRNEENALKSALSSYKKLILDEIQKEAPDSSKLVIWKNAVFAKSLKYDSLVKSIEENFPDYFNLKYSNETVEINQVQDRLAKKDLLIEYKIADSNLIIFCLSKDSAYLIRTKLNDNFTEKVEDYVSFINKFPLVSNISAVFNDFASTSHELYNILIGPIDNINQYSKLIIVPDDILGYMTFEALVQKEFEGEKANYHGLDYLIRDFTVSYSNSATILLHKISNGKKPGNLLAMAPNYNFKNTDTINTSINLRDLSRYLNPLEYTLDEVKNISSVFDGQLLIEGDATERNFKNEASKYGILHFAMHTIINDEDPLTSKLVFSLNNDTLEDGFLNTYEIYNLNLNAELAVLSACKTGFGKLSKGEGIMSLARGFLYAGVPGIVMTLWEVEDISSSIIMTDFYKLLKEGYHKDEALREAKLLYLESANQLNSHPYFWAAYVQIGDDSPVGQSSKMFYLILGIAAILLIGVGFYIFRRRKKI